MRHIVFDRLYSSVREAVRRLGLTGLAVLALGLAQPALSQSLPAQSPLDGLPASAAARLVEPAVLSEALAQTGAVYVIVEFDPPELPAGIQSGTLQADPLIQAGVGAAQDRILSRIAGATPDAPATAAALAEVESGLSVQRMSFSPMFAAIVDAATLRALAEDPEVVRIHPNIPEPPLLTNSLPLIGMPAAYAAGGTGQGQVVAVLDSGARVTHEHLVARLVSGACYGSNVPSQFATSLCPGGATAVTTLASSDDCTNPDWFGCGHGTHVASTAAGFVSNPGANVPPHGVARDARLVSINVFSLFSSASNLCPGGFTHCILSYPSDQILGLERVFTLRNSYSIAAVNMSLGGGQHFSPCTNDSRRPIMQTLTNAGIAVIVAAGNDGFNTSLGAPACIPEAIAIGNTTNADGRSPSSNWGDQVVLTAPGTSIRAAYINGNSNTSYASLTGTSMAAPHVAGAFAAIRTVHPAATVAQIVQALIATGTPVTAAGTTIPRINVDAAIALLGGGAAAPTATQITGPASSNQGQSVTFAATVTSGGGTPTGNVSFRSGGTQFGSATLNASGQASFTTSSLPVGTNSITAVYLGAAGFQGSTSSTLTHVVAAPQAPPNNLFANRITIAAPGTVTGTNVGATAEVGQPPIVYANSTNAVWWRFTPATNGTLTIDTFGSAFDTTLAVFTGSAVNALTLVAQNDDANNTVQSRVSFAAQAGVQYQIAVAGYQNASGSITLNLAFQGTNQATTTTHTAPATGVAGVPLSFAATVSAAAGTPTGTVSFRRNGTEFANANLNAQGQASVSGIQLPAGTYSITAVYPGATGFLGSSSSPTTLVVSDPPAGPAVFMGGGAVFAQSDECQAALGTVAHPVTLRYSPSELGGLPSGVTIAWAEGAEHLAIWGPMAPSGNAFLGGAGRQTWTRFVFYPVRPLIRIVARTVTEPGGGTLEAAQEIYLRLRVQEFAAIPRCAVTVTGTLRRQ